MLCDAMLGSAVVCYDVPCRLFDRRVGSNSFIDASKTHFDGTNAVSEVTRDTEFGFPLLHVPEILNAHIGLDNQVNIIQRTLLHHSKRLVLSTVSN